MQISCLIVSVTLISCKYQKVYLKCLSKPSLSAVLGNKSQRGQILPLPAGRGLRGFMGCRNFGTQTVMVLGKPGRLDILHVTEHVTGLSQSDDFSWNLTHDARTQGLLGLLDSL